MAGNMTYYLLLLLPPLLLLGSERTRAMKLTLVTSDQCLGSGHVANSLSAINELHCSTACVRDGKCQGFCFLPANGSCLLTHLQQTEVVGQLVESAGTKVFFIEVKSGFLRRGDKSYRFFTSAKNQGNARKACLNLNTHLSVPVTAEEREYIRELAPNHHVWVLADDYPHEGSWRNSDTEEVLAYVPWQTGEPQGGTGENCARDALTNPGGWADVTCGAGYYYFCQANLF